MDQDEAADRRRERLTERWHGDGEVERHRRNERGEQDDLNAQTAGPRADLLVDALLERETIGDRRQEDRGPVACETRGDPDGERLQRDPRAVVA